MSISSPLPPRSHDYRRGAAMSVLAYVHHLFNVDQCQASMHTLRWKDRPLQCPQCQSQESIPWGSTTTAPAANAPGVTAASAPSTTSPRPACTGARGRCRTGYSPPSCCAYRARRDGLLGSEGAIPGRALAGVGGCGIRPCPTKPIASWRAPWKRMTSTTSLGTKAKPSRAGQNR